MASHQKPKTAGKEAVSKKTAASTSSTPSTTKTVAIACQGGGAQVAFGAGALKALISAWPEDYELIGLTGASGGAVNATLVWLAYLKKQPDLAIQLLDGFWNANSTLTLPDAIVNKTLVSAVRLSEFGLLPLAAMAPLFGNIAQASLRNLINEFIPFSAIPSLVASDSPRLLISAVDVLSGEFHIFENAAITSDALLASCAAPEIFPPVTLAGTNGQKGTFWDGLYSENPPVSGLLGPDVAIEKKPDEIWVIQIDPETIKTAPDSTSEISNRINQLSSNLSLNQAIANFYLMNKYISLLPPENFKTVVVRRIAMPAGLNLDVASELDRSPAFIDKLMTIGEQAGENFLSTLPDGNLWEPSGAPAVPVMHNTN